ncbi:MAG: STAS domain-containing protein [Chloroflexales bacterium]|nr:STAS domain-containing protein [Chloroflexales bacterium]
MTTSTTTPNKQATQLAYLHQFIAVYTPVLFGFGIAFVLLALFLGDLATGVSSAVILSYSLLMLVAWQRVRRNEIQTPVVFLCGGFLVTALLVAISQPFLFITLSLIPLLVMALALPYISGRASLWLAMICWLEIVVIMMIGSLNLAGPFGTRFPDWLITALSVISTCSAAAVIMLILWQFSSRLNATLAQTHETNDALRTALTDVEERAATQAQLLDEISQQQSTIRELSVPILPINKRTLLLPLIGTLDTQRLESMREFTLEALHRSSARLLILDVTGMATLDTQVARELLDLGQMARLLGVEVAMVGIRAEVAQTLTALNIDMTGLHVYRDLEMVLTMALMTPSSNGLGTF